MDLIQLHSIFCSVYKTGAYKYFKPINILQEIQIEELHVLKIMILIAKVAVSVKNSLDQECYNENDPYNFLNFHLLFRNG